MKPIKNALIINGTTYAFRRQMYLPGMGDPCELCSLRRRCDNHVTAVLCAPFDKKGYVGYFKKLETRQDR